MKSVLCSMREEGGGGRYTTCAARKDHNDIIALPVGQIVPCVAARTLCLCGGIWARRRAGVGVWVLEELLKSGDEGVIDVDRQLGVVVGLVRVSTGCARDSGGGDRGDQEGESEKELHCDGCG